MCVFFLKPGSVVVLVVIMEVMKRMGRECGVVGIGSLLTTLRDRSILGCGLRGRQVGC